MRAKNKHPNVRLSFTVPAAVARALDRRLKRTGQHRGWLLEGILSHWLRASVATKYDILEADPVLRRERARGVRFRSARTHVRLPESLAGIENADLLDDAFAAAMRKIMGAGEADDA